jgi:hypothetical protein
VRSELLVGICETVPGTGEVARFPVETLVGICLASVATSTVFVEAHWWH